MRQQLETLAHLDRVASLGELAASLAHELNQPLAAILSNAEVAHQMLGMSPTPVEALREILADVIADDERAGRIIRNMRAMLRRHEVEAVALDVNTVATEITRLVAHDARLRCGEITLDLAAGLPEVTMDATQLKQVLLNLVLNGVDAMASLHVRQPLELRTCAGDGGVQIEVRDHGPGIHGEVLTRLFDPFFTTKPDGLGVGLAITRSIVESAGGWVAAANASGGGAVFTVWLPASSQPHEVAGTTRSVAVGR
jgi:C4-dicarboxylate-specific signal transduction histidine kinase